MANIKSQIKRNRQNELARERNKSVRSALKTSVRRFEEALAAGKTDDAKLLANVATQKLDKAASKKVIHKNQAANRKSGLAKQVAGL
ncbi:MAG: 30S ribosomal protein S20 [Aeromicrobium sp.]